MITQITRLKKLAAISLTALALGGGSAQAHIPLLDDMERDKGNIHILPPLQNPRVIGDPVDEEPMGKAKKLKADLVAQGEILDKILDRILTRSSEALSILLSGELGTESGKKEIKKLVNNLRNDLKELRKLAQ